MKKKSRIAIMHYSAPPVVGGVEFIIDAHAKLFAEHDYEVKLIVGEGAILKSSVGADIIPEISSTGGPLSSVLDTLRSGRIPDDFEDAVSSVEKKIRLALDDVDVCLMHNILTMHFNLVLTAAMARIIESTPEKLFVGWTHDLTFTDPNYAEHQKDEYPWRILKEPIKGCHYCVISAQRRDEMKKIFNMKASHLPVIPDGIDIHSLLGLSKKVVSLFENQKLFRKDIVALTPTRIVRRKNLEVGMEILSALKRLGKSVRWMITGAPDSHNTDSLKYFNQLVEKRKKLDLEKEVIFLCELFEEGVSNDDLRGLYSISNMLLFPSEREGFGIPVLEAGLMGLLVVISDIPALRELGGSETVYIYPGETHDAVACRIVRGFGRSPRLMFRRKILSNYSWDAIFVDKIMKVVEKPNSVWRGQM